MIQLVKKKVFNVLILQPINDSCYTVCGGSSGIR